MLSIKIQIEHFECPGVKYILKVKSPIVNIWLLVNSIKLFFITSGKAKSAK